MSEVIYAMPDMAKKVRFNRGEVEERIVDIYVSADTPGLHDPSPGTEDAPPNTVASDQLSGTETSEKRPFRAAAVCLGLLCVLLLAGIIGLSVYLYSTRDQLQTSYNNLTEERDQLLTSNNALTKERDDLQRKTCCAEGWRKFDCSCYFLSAESKTWEESKQDCRDRGADLVVINSREEQDYISDLISLWAWIGLTESQGGTWKWVDGTPLTTEYWGDKQPNNRDDEDCVGIYNYESKPFQWHDFKCSDNMNWICEKMV